MTTPPTVREALERCLKVMDTLHTELTDRGYYCEKPDDETPWQTVCSKTLEEWHGAIKQAHAALASDSMKDNDERHG